MNIAKGSTMFMRTCCHDFILIPCKPFCKNHSQKQLSKEFTEEWAETEANIDYSNYVLLGGELYSFLPSYSPATAHPEKLIPTDGRQKLISKAHLEARHRSWLPTLWCLQTYCDWPGMATNVKQSLALCPHCQGNKQAPKLPSSPQVNNRKKDWRHVRSVGNPFQSGRRSLYATFSITVARTVIIKKKHTDYDVGLQMDPNKIQSFWNQSTACPLYYKPPLLPLLLSLQLLLLRPTTMSIVVIIRSARRSLCATSFTIIARTVTPRTTNTDYGVCNLSSFFSPQANWSRKPSTVLKRSRYVRSVQRRHLSGNPILYAIYFIYIAKAVICGTTTCMASDADKSIKDFIDAVIYGTTCMAWISQNKKSYIPLLLLH